MAMNDNDKSAGDTVSRRRLLQTTAAGVGGLVAASGTAAAISKGDGDDGPPPENFPHVTTRDHFDIGWFGGVFGADALHIDLPAVAVPLAVVCTAGGMLLGLMLAARMQGGERVDEPIDVLDNLETGETEPTLFLMAMPRARYHLNALADGRGDRHAATIPEAIAQQQATHCRSRHPRKWKDRIPHLATLAFAVPLAGGI